MFIFPKNLLLLAHIVSEFWDVGNTCPLFGLSVTEIITILYSSKLQAVAVSVLFLPLSLSFSFSPILPLSLDFFRRQLCQSEFLSPHRSYVFTQLLTDGDIMTLNQLTHIPFGQTEMPASDFPATLW